MYNTFVLVLQIPENILHYDVSFTRCVKQMF